MWAAAETPSGSLPSRSGESVPQSLQTSSENVKSLRGGVLAAPGSGPEPRTEKKKETPAERASVLQLFFISLDGVFSSPPGTPGKKGENERGENSGPGADRKKQRVAPAGDVTMEDAAATETEKVQEQATEIDQDGDQVAAMALEARLQLNPFDAAAWDALLEMNESSELYERVLASFPTSVNYWRRYAEFCYRTGKLQAASAVYRRCIYACPHLDLWLSYLRFLYRVGSLQDFVQNLRRAADKVGFCHRSAPLWMELLALYIRVHNTLLLLKGNTQGLLSAPNIPGSTAAGLSPTPLLASEAEQRSFCRPMSATVGPLSEKLSDVNVLRTAFQQCLSTAIDGLDGVWAAYCAFETAVGANNTQLAAKLTGEMEAHYDASKHAYQEIVRLTRHIDPAMLAVPLHEAVKTEQVQVQLEAWRALLRYEKRNPLRLQASPLLRRLTHLFQGCLLSCAFVADFWAEFFQLLLAHNHPHKAVAVLRRAIEQFLPDDELLQLVLADFLESRRLVNAADAVYRSALAVQAQLQSAPSPLSPLAETVQDGGRNGPGDSPAGLASAVMLIRYLDFIRRTHVSDCLCSKKGRRQRKTSRSRRAHLTRLVPLAVSVLRVSAFCPSPCGGVWCASESQPTAVFCLVCPRAIASFPGAHAPGRDKPLTVARLARVSAGTNAPPSELWTGPERKNSETRGRTAFGSPSTLLANSGGAPPLHVVSPRGTDERSWATGGDSGQGNASPRPGTYLCRLITGSCRCFSLSAISLRRSDGQERLRHAARNSRLTRDQVACMCCA
ncbi:hypothetical protein NCLIV_030680 [Neospora caninum Liverpool]|uniref:mRNA 3'-end-processing protein RNA14 n=1 Tax=Neospora caninum (strain Liverpool) TaxID=572307 RepID=F0VHS0_NEOCL|nr:hypothetical protein NCLIV_030680 [Neospora caninum Liverpool]CBZ53281.1 hypothetical protein NCLIV_030680 [Neospora caninum Liverpool]CEL67267.1 TPA: mRNA 3'-end-processing protein RNA14 [Neospora caninum Liverpool]|eukprot:XP_003883313.1 hypothetical protein NCLIV_030680 [Neospora caninum Liverpool]